MLSANGKKKYFCKFHPQLSKSPKWAKSQGLCGSPWLIPTCPHGLGPHACQSAFFTFLDHTDKTVFHLGFRHLYQELANLFLKGQVADILGFVGQKAKLKTIRQVLR